MTQGSGGPPASATKTGLGQEELRRNNLSALLTRVHVQGATSRASLTRDLGLNRSTIGGLAATLEELGLVTERQPAVVRRTGRPSLVLEPQRDNVAVAVDIGVDRIVTALVALGGDVLHQRQRPHAAGEHDVEHVIESTAQMVEEVLAAHRGVRCLGIGVSVPGAVRDSDGTVRFAPNLGWVDQPFTELLSGRLGRPVFTGNDANLGVHLRAPAWRRGRTLGRRLPQRQRRHRRRLPGGRGSCCPGPAATPARWGTCSSTAAAPCSAGAATSAAGRPRSARTSCWSWRGGSRAADRRGSTR